MPLARIDTHCPMTTWLRLESDFPWFCRKRPRLIARNAPNLCSTVSDTLAPVLLSSTWTPSSADMIWAAASYFDGCSIHDHEQVPALCNSLLDLS